MKLLSAALWALQMLTYQKVFELPYRKPWRRRERRRSATAWTARSTA